jgi:hypothetical protein
MEVVWDLQDGHRAEYGLNGWTIERRAVVHGVSGTGSAKIWNAALAPGLPAIGDAHPVFTKARLERGLVEAVASDTVTFRFFYTEAYSLELMLDTVRVGGGLSQVSSAVDRNGIYQTLTYNYPADHPYLPSRSISVKAEVTKLIPDHIIQKRRRETANPTMKAQMYLGKVNSGPWSLAPTAAPYTWLCTQLEGVSTDGMQTWFVDYGFQHRETWKQPAIYYDQFSGKIPGDVDDAVLQPFAMKWIEPYPIMDFDGLAL